MQNNKKCGYDYDSFYLVEIFEKDVNQHCIIHILSNGNQFKHLLKSVSFVFEV